MSNTVIGVAGHIDHGKTTLVQKLTGVNTDSLPEEKKRGMTIDVGFTKLQLPNGESVGLIDVPGHEKFIKNMTAGVSSINFVILVVACDDGIMPQTIEHFDIVTLLGVQNGIVVLTKSDLVDEKHYTKVKEQCNNFFKGSFLENNIYSVSPKNELDYIHLKQIISEKIKNVSNSQEKFFRMNIDRTFSVKGYGTVVTGTISSGTVNIGDDLTIYPQKKEVKVKNIQNHGNDVHSLNFGHRCALNLTNIEKDDIKRGDVLAKKETIYTDSSADVEIFILTKIKKLKNNSRVRVDLGTSEIIGKVVFADRNYLTGGEKCYGKIVFETPVSGSNGDIGIIRNYSPVTTIGRIKIINIPSEKFKKYDEKYINMLQELNSDDTEKIIENRIRYFYPVTLDEIENYARTSSKKILEHLKEKKIIYALEKRFIHKDNLQIIFKRITEILNAYHDKHHLEPGVTKIEIKNMIFSEYSSKEFTTLLDLAVANNIIKVNGDYISLKDFKIKLNKDEKVMKEVIFSIYKKQKFNLKSYDSLYNSSDNKDFFALMHNYMVKNGFIIHTKDNYFILKGYLKEGIKIITRYFESNDTLTVAKTRELLNCNRDSAILILQTLDSLKITKQLNDIRILIK